MKLSSFISIELFIILFLPLTYIFHNSKISIFELDNKSPSNSEFLSIPKENKKINPTAANLKLNSYGALLWKGTAETGDLSEWSPNGGNHLMNPNRVLFSNASKDRAKSGTNSYKLTVDAGTDMASTQLYRYGKSGQPNSNKDAIYTA